MLEKLQFEQLKLSNELQREVEEKKKLQEQLDGGAKEPVSDTAGTAPEAVKEENRILTDQVKAWEVRTNAPALLLRSLSLCRGKCES